MSKLEELLQGVDVKWLSVDEIFTVKNGYTPSKSKEEYWKEGTIPWFRMEDIRKNGRLLNNALQNVSELALKGKLIPANSLIMSTTATLGEHALVQVPFLTNQQITSFSLKDLYVENINTKYLFYCFFDFGKWCKKNANQNGGLGIIGVSKLKKYKFPIPCPDNPEKSLEIQQEIVRVLDELTSLTNQLKTELETERQNRKKQFEFFREQLFRFEEKEVKYISLGELSKIGDGLHGTPKYNDSGNYYFINGNNLNSGEILITDRTKKVDDNTYNKYGIEFSKNKTIFLSINGTIGSVSFYNDEKIVLGKSVAYFNIISNELLHKYLYYIFQLDFSKNYFEKNKTGSTIKNLGLKALRSFKIPILPLEEQERIVKLLDQFDATHTAIEEEISKEIKLRTQQYEYYREKLLSFPQN